MVKITILISKGCIIQPVYSMIAVYIAFNNFFLLIHDINNLPPYSRIETNTEKADSSNKEQKIICAMKLLNALLIINLSFFVKIFMSL